MNLALFPDWKRRYLVLAPPVVVVLAALVLLATIAERHSRTAAVQQSYQLIGTVRLLELRLVDAETGQRGFLITGDTTYLAPYHGAEQDARRLLGVLQRRPIADSAQLTLLAAINRNVSRRLAILALPIARRADSFEAAKDQLIAGRGRESMAQLRALIGNLEQRELARLQQELARQRLTDWAVVAVAILGSLLVLLVSFLTRRQFDRYERELEASNAELAGANATLQEQAVELEAQTEELQASNDELQRQRLLLEDQAVELETANEHLESAYQLAEDNRRAAEQANRTKTRFLTSMSHELRTPLNAIAGYVDLLQLGVHGPVTDAQRSCLERIRHNGQHLLVLINDILDYAKLQAGRVELRTRDVGLADLIVETEPLVQPLLQARRVTFHGPPPTADLAVRGDPDRIRQILLNLLSNAAKYTDAGGSVAITTELDGERVRVRVRDTGHGIPVELQAAIFDPFVQVNRGANGSLTDGVGLGLSISRELALAMDGDLSVESTPGQGSTFTLTLRRAPAASA